jgi:hypothetical protein
MADNSWIMAYNFLCSVAKALIRQVESNDKFKLTNEIELIIKLGCIILKLDDFSKFSCNFWYFMAKITIKIFKVK